LREFIEWTAQYEKTSSCCQRATDEEITADRKAGGNVYNCDECPLMSHQDGLWLENAEAWNTHHLLCGRTVRELKLEGWLLQRWTDDWALERVLGLLDRLNLIASVLEPHGRSPN
jgi:hypothetical protein